MATYTPPSISNYNDNPPTNDGSTNFTDNGVDWTRHIDEIGDPVVAYVDAVNAETDAAFDRVDAGKFLSVTDYGATGDGSTDDTIFLQAAIDAAESQEKGLFIPSGNYLITDTLDVSKGIIISGEGDKSRIVVEATVDATTDIFNISSTTATDDDNTRYGFKDFRITPASGTPGRYGFSIDIRTIASYAIRWESVRVDQLGSNAIRTIPNASPIADGFFTSIIENCTLYGGIYLVEAGDSIRILNNTILGTGVGIYADLVGSGGSDGGAHGLDIIGNNITSNGGALNVINAWAGRFARNVVEVPSPSGMVNNACISVTGESGNDIRNFVISQNFLSTAATFDVIYIGYSSHAYITQNYIARKTGQFQVVVSANGEDTHIIDNTDALDEAKDTILSDAGTRTDWRREFGGNVEQTQHLYFIAAEQGIKCVDSAGDPKLIFYGSATDDTCKVGFTEAPDTNGHLLFYADGSEAGRFDPDGNLLIGTASPSADAIVKIDSTTQGVLLPRMTTTQKNAISGPDTGLMVFDTTIGKLAVYTGAAWQTVTSA